MPAYVALLRGINVGGNRMIKMADLRTVFVAADADDVATHIQSGNVVFTHPARSERTLAAELEKRIAKAAGFPVPVVLRTAGQLARVMARIETSDRFLVVSRRAHRSSTWAGRDLESAANTVMNAGSVFGMGTR